MPKTSHPDLKHGDRKQVTVLFADIVRSSDIVRKLDSETAQNVFNQVILRQIEIVEKFGGTVNQVMGDGVMCLFGAEAPYEEHALRAVSAAREILRGMADVQRRNRNVPLRIRIGINTGEVTLTRPQNKNYRSIFQATGETVHVTDRVLKQAKPNGLAISAATKEYVDRYYRFKKLGSMRWTPDAEHVDIYAPTALKSPESFHVRHTPGNVPRPALESRILSLLDQAQVKKHPRIVWLYGAPGVGKTHLASRFVHSHLKNRFQKRIQIHFFPDSIDRPEQAFEKILLREIFGRDRKAALKRAVDIGGAPFLQDCLRDMMGAGDVGDAYHDLEASEKVRMKAELVARLLLSAAEEKDVLLTVEDAHWAKEDSLVYLESIIRLCRGREKLIILATSRQRPPFSGLETDGKIREILVDPMTAREGQLLLKGLDRADRLSPAIRVRIHHLSGGNPYFICEYFNWADAAAEKGVTSTEIRRKLDRYTPGKIADILYNRLATAGDVIVRVARIAAVLGMRIRFDLLHAICGHERKMLLSIMERLEEADIVRKDGMFPAAEWVFAHELLQKVIYDSIPKSTRVQWHRAVIGQMKKCDFKSIDDRYRVMAGHADKAEDSLLTYVYSKWAARQENAASRYESGLDLSRCARRALGDIAGLKNRARHNIRARLFEISGLFITGKYAQAIRHLEEMLKRQDILKRQGYLEQVLSFQELYFWVRGDLKEAAKTAQAILSLDMKGGGRDIYIRENSRLGNLSIDMGRYREAVLHDLRVVRAIPDDAFEGKFGLLVQAKPASLASLALAHAELGNVKYSRKYFNRAYEFLSVSDDDFTRIFVLVYLAHSLIVQDKDREALGLLKTAEGYCAKTGASLLQPYMQAAQGIVLARTGHMGEGVALCRAALAAAQNKPFVCTSQFEVWLAEALMESGEDTEARRVLKQVLVSAARHHEAGILALAHYLLARGYRGRARNVRQMRFHLRSALQLAQKSGMRTLEEKIRPLTGQEAGMPRRRDHVRV